MMGGYSFRPDEIEQIVADRLSNEIEENDGETADQ